MIKCKYDKCKEELPENNPEEYCIYHLPKEKKGISGEEFNKLIREKFIVVGKNNFRGFIFPAGIDFSKLTKEFIQKVDFRDAKFEGTIGDGDFAGCCVVFNGMNFKQEADFMGAQFSGGDALFQGTRFSGGDALFGGTKFSGGKADFGIAQFTGGDANFGFAQFGGGNALFHGARFSGGDALFGGAKFSGGVANFVRAEFGHDAHFIDITFMGDVNFCAVKFTAASKFYFKNPRFLLEEVEYSSLIPHRIIFEHIQFIPNMAYFEDVKKVSYKICSRLPNTIMIFRYCDMSNVYFINNNMSLFSFYKSQYEKALFYSNEWDEQKEYRHILPFRFRYNSIYYRRKNIIFDELLFERSKSLTGYEQTIFKEACKIADLRSYREVASLYRRFKVALDATKDYTESGWLYFNEFEMKQRALKEGYSGKKWSKSFWERCYYGLYLLYKYFTGFGEKPLWSFLWLISFSFLFSCYYVFSGLKISNDRIINYDMTLNCPDMGNYIIDCLYVVAFTITRIFPQNYLPSQWEGMVSTGWGGGAVTFMNTIIIVLLTIFIGIGLKRHFRRF